MRSALKRRSWVSALLVACVVAVPAGSVAQDGHSFYVSAGWAAGSREVGSAFRRTDDAGERSFGQAIVLGAGIRLVSWFGVEGSVQFQEAQSFPWRFTYFSFDNEEIASDRDTP